MSPDRHARPMSPIPNRPAPGLTTYDAKDPARGSRFTGRISWVQLDVGADDHVIDPDERLRTAMARQ